MEPITKFNQKRLVNAIASELPSFKKLKFKFFESHDNFFHIIDLSFINIGGGRKLFSIYYGVHVPLINKILWDTNENISNIPATTCVFDCNINDLITGFEGKGMAKYWELTGDENLYIEIKELVKTRLFPFTQKISSLDNLNTIIENLEFPTKHTATKPAMFVALKSILSKDNEVKSLVKRLKEENYYALPLLDKILMLE